MQKRGSYERGRNDMARKETGSREVARRGEERGRNEWGSQENGR